MKKINIPDNIIKWLLEEENPSIRYRTMVELLDYSETDSQVISIKEKILDYTPVVNMLEAMHPNGYWEEMNPRSKILFGSGVEYQTQTTHFILAYLAELGLTKEYHQVAKAADRYLSLQKADGDFWNHFSCLYAMNVRTFVKLGYRKDPRVEKTLDLIRNSIRWDKGYLCDTHEGKYKTREVKSCIRGSAKVLYALEVLPELWKEPFVKNIAEHFLNREILFKSSDKAQLVRKDAGYTFFPFTWKFGLIDVLLPLAKMGFGEDSRMKRAWNVLEKHRTQQGEYVLDKDTKCKYWKVGKAGEPNKWVTFYSYLCLKYK